MVRHRQLHPKQPQNAAGERLGLAPGEAEHQAQGQHPFGRTVGATTLAAGCCAFRRRPAGKGSLVQPHREVATPAQAGFVSRPVRDPVAGARNAAASGGVVFEQHQYGVA